MPRILGIIFACFCCISSSFAEDLRHTITVDAGAMQIKEAENLGMVFRGPEAGAGYALTKDFGQFNISYCADLSIAGVFSRGMTGYCVAFTPATIGIHYDIVKAGSQKLAAGLCSGLKYHWQMYPDLHNSQLFAESEIPLDLHISYECKYKRNRFALNLQNSLFGFVGQLPMHDPYFYSLSFSEFAFKPLQDLKFLTFGKYNHSRASLLWSPAIIPAHGFGIGLEYISCQSFKSLSYSLLWRKSF